MTESVDPGVTLWRRRGAMGCSSIVRRPLGAARLERLVPVALAASIAVLSTACSTTPSAARATPSSSSAVADAPTGQGCQQTFVLRGKLESPSSAEPAAAVAAFLTKGSIAASGRSIANPVSEGFPAGGWVPGTRSADRVTFDSGGSQLVVDRTGSATWQVVSGHSTSC